MMEQLKDILDRKLFSYLLLFFLVSFFLSSFSAVIGKWEGFAYSSYSWNDLFANLVIRYVSKFLFILASIIIIRTLVVKNFIAGWIGTLLHFFLAVTLTFYSVFIQILASNFFLGTNDEISWEYVFKSAILGTDYNFFLYFCAIAIVYAYYFFQKKKDFELKESNLKTQLLDSKMNALQSQLQPHFLFNALNDISSLIDESPEKSQDAIADLSDLLRQTLALKDTKFISIKDEIDLLKKYLEIEKIRFQNKLNFNIRVSEDLSNRNMPPLLLQPIVENSIKHGYSYDHDTLGIVITIEEEKDQISFHIINDGKPLDTNEINYGTGIHNVVSRLSTLFDDKFLFEMRNMDDNRVCTVLKIPKKLYRN